MTRAKCAAVVLPFEREQNRLVIANIAGAT
jgi:hypothetical protein